MIAHQRLWLLISQWFPLAIYKNRLILSFRIPSGVAVIDG